MTTRVKNRYTVVKILNVKDEKQVIYAPERNHHIRNNNDKQRVSVNNGRQKDGIISKNPRRKRINISK